MFVITLEYAKKFTKELNRDYIIELVEIVNAETKLSVSVTTSAIKYVCASKIALARKKELMLFLSLQTKNKLCKCRSPPSASNMENLRIWRIIKMENCARCFIKTENGEYKEITYKELKMKRQKDGNYRDKKFIPLYGMLMEVSTKDYKEFYKNIERNRYIRKLSRKFGTFSINAIAMGDEENKDILQDKDIDIELEVERKIEIEKLKNVLLKLDEDEYKIVKALFYEKKTVREYARKVGMPFTTIQSRKIKILNKLKKLLE